jgi:hypothetical protein
MFNINDIFFKPTLSHFEWMIENKQFPDNVQLKFEFGQFGNNRRNILAKELLLQMMELRQPLKNAYISLWNIPIDAQWLHSFLEPLKEGHYFDGITIDFYACELNDDCIKAIVELLKAGGPEGLCLNFKDCDLSADNINSIIDALKEQHGPKGLAINFEDNDNLKECIPNIASLLAIKAAPENFKLNLRENRVYDDGAALIAQALENAPEGFMLDLGVNGISKVGATALAHALEKAPKRFHLNLSSNSIGSEGAEAFANALQKGAIPEGLELNLSYNYSIGDVGASYIADALKLTNRALISSLNMSATGLTEKGLGAFSHVFSGQNGFPKHFKLYLKSLHRTRTKEEDYHAGLATMLGGLQDHFAPKGLELHLTSNSLGNESLAKIADYIEQGKFIEDTLINLDFNLDIGDKGLEALSRALMSPKAPVNLKLSLSTLGNSSITPQGVEYLGHALASGKAPNGLSLNLRGIKLCDDGIISFINSLQDGQLPQDLTLNLIGNRIGVKGAVALVEFFKTSRLPKGLKLLLGNNNFGEATMDLIMAAIENAPANFQLQLLDTPISIAHLKAIVKVLLSNTNVTNLVLTNVYCFETQQIQRYCLRNNLIFNHPECETYIKKICYKNNMYATPISSQETSSITSNFGIFSNDQHLLMSLPKPVHEFCTKLETLGDPSQSLSRQNVLVI